MQKVNYLPQKRKAICALLPKIFIAGLALALTVNFVHIGINHRDHSALTGDIARVHLALNDMRLNFTLLGLLMGALLLLLWVNYSLHEKKVNERVRLLLDATPLSCSLWDRELNIIDCNAETLRLFGLSDKKEFRDGFLALSPSLQPCGRASEEMVREVAAKTFRDGYCRFEWTHRSLRGELIPCEVTAVRLVHREMEVVAAYIKDLREQMAADAEVREANALTRLLLDATPLSCSLWDRSFTVLDCNTETLRLFGLPDKKAFQDGFLQLSPSRQPCGRSSAEMARENVAKTFRDGYCRFPWIHQSLRGEAMPCEVILVRIGHRGNHIVAAYIKDQRERAAAVA